AAVQVLNASNIQVAGSVTGIPVVAAPPVAALTSASNAAGSATKSMETPSGARDNKDTPSIIIVEFLGFGGGDGDPPKEQRDKPREEPDQRSYNGNSAFQIVGVGELTDAQKEQLAAPAPRRPESHDLERGR